MAEDRKTQPVPKVYPFDRDTIRIITGNPEASISRATISVCEICRPIPETSSGEEGFPRGLVERAEIRPDLQLLRCPVCGCLYKWEPSPQPQSGGAHRPSLTRMQRGDAFELLLGQEAKFILRQGERWFLKW